MSVADGGSEPPSAARTALAWLAVFAGSLLAAAVLAPAAYALLLALDPATRWPFSRVFDRLAMATALAALILFRRATGWRELGPRLDRTRAAGLLAGYLAALVAVAAGTAWAFAAGRLGPPEVPIDLATARTAKTLAGALAAATLEEVFFRGLLLGSLARRLRWPLAAALSSLAYAGVHLLASEKSFTVRGFEPGAGFAYLGQVLARQLEPEVLAPLAGLFLIGAVLAAVVRRSGSLDLAIGLHAAWAGSFAILRRASQVLVEIPGDSFLATHHYLVGTPWAWAAIALSGALVHAGLALGARSRAPRASPAST